MSDKFFVGFDLTGFSDNGAQRPISRVTLMVDDENAITAGDDSGVELLANCPHATQEMVNAILLQTKGKLYRMFTAESARLDPAAELGDGVTAGGVYSAISRLSDDGSGFLGIAAPGKAELEDEYPAGGPMTQEFNRKIAETRSYIEKTSTEIRFGVANDLKNMCAEINIQLDSITLAVNDAQGDISSLRQTATVLSTQISDANKNISSIEQYAKSITLSVSNKDTSSTITLKAGSATISSQTIEFTGLVSFADLSAKGKTTINGDNITTGTISADRIDVSNLKVDTLWGTSTKVALYAESDNIYVGGRNTYETFSKLYLYGQDITLSRWGDSNSGISVKNGLTYYIRPNVSNIYTLGDSTHHWEGCYTNSVTITTNSSSLYGMTLNYLGIIPAKSEHLNLGSSTYKWNFLHTYGIVLDGLRIYANRVSDSDSSYVYLNSQKQFIPYASTGYYLGSSSYYWESAYISKLYLSSTCYIEANNSSSIKVGGSTILSSSTEPSSLKSGTYEVTLNTYYFRPNTSANYYLGDSTHYWYRAYISTIYFTSSCYIEGSSSSLLPGTNNSHYLGSSSKYWKYIYAERLYLMYSSYSSIYLSANSNNKLCVNGTAIH